ncbi:helix-turn-helix domain-containing protein [Streptomyces sp. NPDC048370]|uniref:helix-turn-helix domain-containing protein n=1 Tax=Streptomyces sp. NPDC048370 TaxID=3365540 RepID=UPI003720B499
MAQTENWNAVIARRVGERVAYFRKRVGEKGITAQALADRCADLGHPLDRTVIAKLEKGLRQSVTVPDLVVLAAALGVSPTALAVPIDQQKDVEILPGQEVPAYEAVTWFAGERWQVWASKGIGPSEDFALVDIYRAHERQVDEWRRQSEQVARWVTEIAQDSSAESRVKWATTMVDGAERELRRVRGELVRLGARLPDLPPGLHHIDEDEGGQA